MVLHRGGGGGTSLEEFPLEYDDNFIRVRPLGHGGYGETYLARGSNGQVVLKELREDRIGFADRFANEALILTKLDHDAIVRVLQRGRWRRSGRLFYAMQYVPGQPLSAYVRQRDTFRWFNAVKSLVDVASALRHAHERGIAHCDVKPANIVVGDEDRATLIDWGLAAPIEVAQQRPAMLDGIRRQGAGTEFYMSPEQSNGHPASAAMDTYSLGATLYEVLSGAPPYSDLVREPSAPPPLEDRTLTLPAEPGFDKLDQTGPPSDLVKRIPKLRELALLAMAAVAQAPSARPALSEIERVLRDWSQRCICERCQRLQPRVGSSRETDGRWRCGDCVSLGIYRINQGFADSLSSLPAITERAPQVDAMPAQPPSPSAAAGEVIEDGAPPMLEVLETCAAIPIARSPELATTCDATSWSRPCHPRRSARSKRRSPSRRRCRRSRPAPSRSSCLGRGWMMERCSWCSSRRVAGR